MTITRPCKPWHCLHKPHKCRQIDPRDSTSARSKRSDFFRCCWILATHYRAVVGLPVPTGCRQCAGVMSWAQPGL